ncbi:MAG: ribosome-associated translation inhibitor RaiA [Patescibacteria group bacterium]
MKINLQGKNLEITPAINDYVMKKVTNLGKILNNIEEKTGEILVNFTVEKTTNHHRSGEVFHADCAIKTNRGNYFSSADEEDLYAAIDSVKDTLFRELSKTKEKNKTLFYRGARKLKNIAKGLTHWKK